MQRLVDDQNRVVHDDAREDDEAEDREDVEVLRRHVPIARRPDVHDEEPREAAERRERHAERDHRRTEEALEEPVTILVADPLGRIVRKLEADSGEVRIDCSELGKGFYLIQLRTKGHTQVIRWLKQ